MSVKKIMGCLLTIGLIFVLISNARARDWADAIMTPLEDPLLARPPELQTGAILPGDEFAYRCDTHADGSSGPLGLLQVINLALCQNPQVKGAWAAIKIQTAQVGEARSAYLPTINAGLSRLKQKNQYPEAQFQVNSDRTSQSQYYTLSWRLLDFGGRDANRRSANAALEAALATHDASLQKTIANVVGLYFDALTIKAGRDAKERNETLAHQTLETAQKREMRGVGSRSDTLQAKTSLAKAELELARAKAAYAKSVVALKVAIGMNGKNNGSADLELAQETTTPGNEFTQSLAEWLALVEVKHPAILAARAHLESVRERLTVARSEGLPSIDFTWSRYTNGRPNQGLSATETKEDIKGLTLNIPLFDGFSRTYKIRGAQAQIEQKETELTDTTNQILGEAAKAHADMISSWVNLGSSERLLSAAQEAQANVQRKYDRGAVDILDVLNVQAALADAEQERIRALSEWRSARLRLFANAGIAGIGIFLK